MGTTQRLSPAGRGSRAAERRIEVTDLPELRPRHVGEIVDTALDVLRSRFLTCVLFASMLWLPVNAMAVVGIHVGGEFRIFQEVTNLFGTIIVQMLSIGLVTVVVYSQMQGHFVGPWRALLIGLRRAPALLIGTILTGIAAGLGTLLCCAPGLILTWLFAVVPSVIVLERVGPIAAIGRSVSLVKGRDPALSRLVRHLVAFLRWFGIIVLQFALVLPASSLPQALRLPDAREPIEAFLGVPSPVFDGLDIVLSSLFLGLSTAVSSVVLTVFYLDLRIRSEGLDLEMSLERLRDDPPSGVRVAGSTTA